MVERNLAKVEVASSSLVSRSIFQKKGSSCFPFSSVSQLTTMEPLWRDSKAVMQRIANPSSPVRLRVAPPKKPQQLQALSVERPRCFSFSCCCFSGYVRADVSRFSESAVHQMREALRISARHLAQLGAKKAGRAPPVPRMPPADGVGCLRVTRRLRPVQKSPCGPVWLGDHHHAILHSSSRVRPADARSITALMFSARPLCVSRSAGVIPG